MAVSVRAHLRKLESYLLQGALGDVSLQDALSSLASVGGRLAELEATGRWYKHRVVKRRDVSSTLHGHPETVEAVRGLSQEVERAFDGYFRNHSPCQRRVDVFYTSRALGGQRKGLTVFVVGTLYGPGSVKDEALEEIVRRGERL